MFIVILGIIATTLTAFVAPSYLITIIKNRHDETKVSAVSAIQPVLVATTGLLYIKYSWDIHGAFAVIITGAIDALIQALILLCLILFSTTAHKKQAGIAITILVVFTALIFWIAPPVVAGAIAATTSIVMHMPQAIKMLINRNKPEVVTGISATTPLLVIGANTVWLVYGILLGSVVLWLPPVFHVASGMIMGWVVLKNRKTTIKAEDVTEANHQMTP